MKRALLRACAISLIVIAFGHGLACAPAGQPEAAKAHVVKGKSLVAEGRIDAAVAEFESALQLDPDAVEAHVQLANIAVIRGRPVEAERRFSALLDRYPDNGIVLAAWGKLLAATGRIEPAEKVLRKAIEADPPSAEAAVDLAGSCLPAAARPRHSRPTNRRPTSAWRAPRS